MSAAIALLSCFSAWQAWRHNPLYSSRSGLWLIGKIVMMLGAAGGAIAGVSMLTADWSMLVQAAALGVTTVLCTLGLILGISAASTPRIARLRTQLPPGTPTVRIYREKVTHWLRVAFVYFGVCALLAAAPEPCRSVALVLALIGGLMSAVMLPTGYVMARRLDRAVTALQLRPWLHWQYPAAFREAWCRVTVARLRSKPPSFILRRDWLKLLGLCVVIVLPALLMLPGPWYARAGWGIACCVLLCFFIELTAAQERRAPEKLANRLKRSPGDAWFGRDGLVCEGHFYTWISPGVYLESALIDPRPPRSVCFGFVNLGAGAYGAPAVTRVSQSVPIPPAARTEDLALLQGYLRNRCPDARINLS